MTGIAELEDFISLSSRNWPARFRHKFWSIWRRKWKGPPRFVVLCWRRTGSNLLCGILYNHKEIFMHNELFNETGIHTYYGNCLEKWNYAKRDFYPEMFLNDMLSSSNKYGRSGVETKAVGFKSFPEHYMDYGAVNFKLFEVFSKIMDDFDFKKVILYRDNVFKVFLSMNRSFMTGHYLTKNYDSVKITIDIPALQKFIDRYLDAYKKYHEMTRGQSIFHMSYEDLTGPAQGDVLMKLFRFLGVSLDTPKPLIENIPQSSQPLSKSIINYADLEFAWRHTNLAQFLDKDFVPAESSGDDGGEVLTPPANTTTEEEGGYYKWALLIPVCSRKSTAAECKDRLEALNASLLATLAPHEYNAIECVFGIDFGDEVYDTPTGKDLLLSIFSEFKVTVRRVVGLEGKVCRIWNELADYAFAGDASFMVLLGDDVTLQTPGWKTGIEATFQVVSKEKRLPYGAACVAFNDLKFPGFPTFPVIHRFHMEVFGTMLPHQFLNQGGDPYLFALYHRYDAAVFVDFSLVNGIGGLFATTRYTKNHIRWNNEILSTGLDVLQKSLQRPYFKAIDIVVPTFRCDVDILRSIVSLRSSATETRVSFWIIVDNPTSPHLESVKELERYERNYSVYVRVHSVNLGASMARNTGMDYSDADYVIFLDDDVVPDCCLIDAYLGAIIRYPDAGVFVGSTHLPPPCNYLTSAYVTSDLIGSYTVAEKRRDPAWGVTANLCVKGRSNRVRFQKEYPKTGGGEDIDYCLRVGRGKAGSVVAVPGAKASHPWWSNGDMNSLFHIIGWARGESLCLESDALREYVYFTGPNGTELCMILAFLFIVGVAVPVGVVPLPLMSSFRSFAMAELGILVMETGWHCNHVHHRVPQPAKKFLPHRFVISVLAAWVIMYQEAGRVAAHLRRGKLTNLFWRLDWVCGKNPEYISRNRVHVILKSALYLVFVVYLVYFQEGNAESVCNPYPNLIGIN